MVQKGKADAELEHATLLAHASREGDVKATIAILEKQHGWAKDAAANPFGEGGITIVIGDVNSPYSGRVIDQKDV
jgi:hypothetical protein